MRFLWWEWPTPSLEERLRRSQETRRERANREAMDEARGVFFIRLGFYPDRVEMAYVRRDKEQPQWLAVCTIDGYTVRNHGWGMALELLKSAGVYNGVALYEETTHLIFSPDEYLALIAR